MESVLHVKGLRKVYQHQKQEIVAVDGVDLDFGPGTIVGLLGPNGAGKTTIIKCSLGLIEPTTGDIKIHGLDIRRERGKALRHIGTVLEGSRNTYWHLSPLENLVFFASIAGIPAAIGRQRALELLEVFGLKDRVNSRVSELSRGMQQKVAICAALIREPDLLFLDEPTLGLDVETTAQLRSLLVRLARERQRTLIISSHQMDLIETICEQVVIIQRGRIITHERVDRLLDLFTTRSYRFHTEQPVDERVIACIRGRLPTAQIECAASANGATPAIGITFQHGAQLYDVMDIFRANGCVIRSIEHETPNLETIFLRLTNGGVT